MYTAKIYKTLWQSYIIWKLVVTSCDIPYWSCKDGCEQLPVAKACLKLNNNILRKRYFMWIQGIVLAITLKLLKYERRIRFMAARNLTRAFYWSRAIRWHKHNWQVVNWDIVSWSYTKPHHWLKADTCSLQNLLTVHIWLQNNNYKVQLPNMIFICKCVLLYLIKIDTCTFLSNCWHEG